MIVMTISGNLVEDPKELYKTQFGTFYALKIASTTHYYDPQKKENVKGTEWASGKVGGNKIKGIFERLTKGRCVFLHSDAVRIKSFTRKDGTTATEFDLGDIKVVELGPPVGEWRQFAPAEQQQAPQMQQARGAPPQQPQQQHQHSQYFNHPGAPTNQDINNPYGAPPRLSPSNNPHQPGEGYGPLPF